MLERHALLADQEGEAVLEQGSHPRPELILGEDPTQDREEVFGGAGRVLAGLQSKRVEGVRARPVAGREVHHVVPPLAWYQGHEAIEEELTLGGDNAEAPAILHISEEQVLQVGTLTRATVERFEAGYCSRGMLAGRLAVPIHSPAGELLAYAGRGLDGDPGWKFPPKFDRQLELYNLHRAAEAASEEGIVVVSDILDVWRLAGAENVVALMGETVSDRQEALVASFAGRSQRVTLALPAGGQRDELVARLASQVFVRTMTLAEFLVRILAPPIY